MRKFVCGSLTAKKALLKYVILSKISDGSIKMLQQPSTLTSVIPPNHVKKLNDLTAFKSVCQNDRQSETVFLLKC